MEEEELKEFFVYVCNDEACSTRHFHSRHANFIKAVESLENVKYDSIIVDDEDNVLAMKKDGKIEYTSIGKTIIKYYCFGNCIIERVAFRHVDVDECYNQCIKKYGLEEEHDKQ